MANLMLGRSQDYRLARQQPRSGFRLPERGAIQLADGA